MDFLDIKTFFEEMAEAEQHDGKAVIILARNIVRRLQDKIRTSNYTPTEKK